MTSDFLYSAIEATVAIFLGLWTLVLGAGLFLSLREDALRAKNSPPANGRSR
jgi:hypothetical protein